MLKYKHLEGLDFDIEKQNCYSILRQFYWDNFQIELTDYACPNNWWKHDLDLYAKLAGEEGFELVNSHPRDYRPGDVIICAIQASTGNHCMVVLDNGQVLHHLVGQRSCVTAYGGLFRNTTVAVYRHRDVGLLQPAEELIDFKDVLPPHVRRRLEDIEAARQIPAQDARRAGDA